MIRISPQNRAEAFTLIELLAMVACLVIVVTVLLPVLATSRHSCCKIDCVNNLKQIGLASRCWALDNNDQYPPRVGITNGGTLELVNGGDAYIHFAVMSNELSTPKLLLCPEEPDSRRIRATSFNPLSAIPLTNDLNISYFVGIDADQVCPSMWLAGDRQISINKAAYKKGLNPISTNSLAAWARGPHNNRGNLCMADGSVAQPGNPALQLLLQKSGSPTNRLAMP